LDEINEIVLLVPSWSRYPPGWTMRQTHDYRGPHHSNDERNLAS
jgi:hypothetical protein